MRGNPRALGSRPTIRDRFSTRHIAESRVTARKNATGSRTFGPNRGGTSRRIDDRRPKPRLELRNEMNQDGPHMGQRLGNSSRRPPMMDNPGNNYHDARPDKHRMERNVASQRQQGFVNRGGLRRPTGFRKPEPHNGPRGMTRPGPRSNFPPRKSDATARLGPPPSMKDQLFQGPKKARPYREEDLKKFKVDIRNSRSPEHKGPKELYDRAELRKFKIDIKGDAYDETQPRRDSHVYLDSHGVPYDEKVLKTVEIQIRRRDVDRESNVDSKSIKRSLDVDKFYVPRQKDVKLLNSRNTFHSPRNQEKMHYKDVKVNLGEMARPDDPPLNRKFEADTFQMYRRPDASPPRVTRKISIDKQNQSRDRQDKFDVVPPVIHPWADEGAHPVFDGKLVTPNVVRLADFFPSESEKLQKPHLGHSQKYPVRSHSPPSRSYERNRDYNDHKRNPPSPPQYHRSDHPSTSSADLRPRPLSPGPAQDKARRGGPPDKPRDRYAERRDAPPPGYDHRPSSASDRNLRRSRSPLQRRGSSPRQRPVPSPPRSRPLSPPRPRLPIRPPSPKRRALSPPARRPGPNEDRYRSGGHDRPGPYEDRYRNDKPGEERYRNDKPVEDKYHGKSTYEDRYAPSPFEDKYRVRLEKLQQEDRYQSQDKDKYRPDRAAPFEDKYRSGPSKPVADDRYRSGGYERSAPFEDKYRSSYDRPPPFEDKFRSEKSHEDKYRSDVSHEDKYRSEGRRGSSGAVPSDKYDTSRRGYEPYPSGRSGDTSRRGGGEDYRERRSPLSSRHSLSTDPSRGRDYYSNGSGGGSGGRAGGGGLMHLVPVFQPPPVYAPFVRPGAPPPHMFRPRGPFIPIPVFMPLPPPPFRFRHPPPRDDKRNKKS